MMDAAHVERPRRNRGWLYVFDENLECIARPSEDSVPLEIDELVHTARARWERQEWPPEMMMMLTPQISARVFSIHGPNGRGVIVYLERLVVRG